MTLPENFVVVDCETTGLSAERHGLLSIGAIVVSGATYYRECLFDERKEVDAEAMKVNGLSVGSDHKPELFPEQAVAELCDWLEARTAARRMPPDTRWIMGGKNPQFDYAFLLAATEGYPAVRDRFRALVSRRTLDLHAVAYWWAIGQAMDLSAPDFETQTIYTRLGFAPEPWPHHALNGARLSMYVFRELTNRWPLLAAGPAGLTP